MTADLLELAVRAARTAGDRLLEMSAGAVETKSSPTDPVSEADRAAEEIILGLLREARPDDAVLAEEGGSSGGSSGIRWIVDPLDGTVNYLFGIPQWSVSVAAEDPDGLLVGVVHDPNRHETFTASRGAGARLNGRPVAVSSCDQLSQALVATGFAYDPEARRRQAERLVGVLPRVRDIRRFGSAALDLAWTAAGRYDAFYESGLGPWDRAAGELLVREAGGRVSPLGGDGLVASGSRLHAALLELLGGEEVATPAANG